MIGILIVQVLPGAIYMEGSNLTITDSFFQTNFGQSTGMRPIQLINKILIAQIKRSVTSIQTCSDSSECKLKAKKPEALDWFAPPKLKA